MYNNSLFGDVIIVGESECVGLVYSIPLPGLPLDREAGLFQCCRLDCGGPPGAVRKVRGQPVCPLTFSFSCM